MSHHHHLQPPGTASCCWPLLTAISWTSGQQAGTRAGHFAFWAMGSVDVDYTCPWCGRVGNGGYAPDWVGYPICTEGRFSCLWLACQERGIDTVQEFRRHQLRTIFPTTYRYDNAISVALDVLAAFLASPPSRDSPEPQQGPPKGKGKGKTKGKGKRWGLPAYSDSDDDDSSSM